MDRLGMLKTPSCQWRWVPGNRSKFGNWTTVPSLYSWNIAECDVKPQPINQQPFFGAMLHFLFHKSSALWHVILLNKLFQVFERYLTKYVLSLTHPFWLLTRAENTIWNRSFYGISNSFCEKHTHRQYTCFNTPYVIPLFSYTDTLFERAAWK